MQNNIAMPLRQAVAEAVSGHAGGYLAVAGYLQTNAQVLRNRLSASGGQNGNQLPLDHLEKIADLTRSDLIAHAVASLCGGVFIRLDDLPDVAGDAAILDEVLALVDDVGRVGHEVRGAIADGEVDELEWQRINRRRAQLVNTVYRLLALVQQLRIDHA